MLSPLELITPPSAPVAAVAALVVWQIAKWVYEYVTMPAAAKNGAKVVTASDSLPFFGNTFAILKNVNRMHDWHAENAERAQGRPVRWKMMGRPAVVMLTKPELVEDVQKTQFECFEKGEYMRENMRDVLGSGIFTADGQHWVHQRKTASNLFTTRMLRESMAVTVEARLQDLHGIFEDSIKHNKTLDMASLISRFTMDSFAEAGFGIELNSLITEEEHPFQSAFDDALEIITKRFLKPQWFWKLQSWLDMGNEHIMKQHTRVVNGLILDIISKSLQEREKESPQQQQDQPQKKTIVSLFLNQHHRNELETGKKEPFDPVFLRDIVLNFLAAGRDTTSTAISWLFYALSQNPEAERKIRAELAAKLPDLMSGKQLMPTMEQLLDLPYLEAAVKESLRLYPVVPSNSRQANRDVVLCDGTFIKKGTTISFPSYVMARMEWVWGADAKEYKPERWIDPVTGKAIHESAFKFNAFLAGPRMCLGMTLALMQVRMVVASILSRYHLEVVLDRPMEYMMHPALKMKHGLPVKVVPAASWA